MTLCIAWKDQHRIHLASDSRLSLPNGQTDIAIKVMTLPFIVYQALPAGTVELEVAHRRNLGICVIGSFITTYTVKELLQDVLASLQFTRYTDTSLAGLANFIKSFLDKISKEVCQVLFEKGMCQIVFTGYCPKEKQGRAFVLSTSISSSSTLVVEVNELFQKRNIEFFGSEKSRAKLLYSEYLDHSNKAVFGSLKKVIEDGSISSVGGNIQYGCLKDKDFRVFGVEDYKVDHEKKCLQIGRFIGGIIPMSDLFKKDEDFALSYNFKRPFQEEIKEFLSKGYHLCNPS